MQVFKQLFLCVLVYLTFGWCYVKFVLNMGNVFVVSIKINNFAHR